MKRINYDKMTRMEAIERVRRRFTKLDKALKEFFDVDCAFCRKYCDGREDGSVDCAGCPLEGDKFCSKGYFHIQDAAVAVETLLNKIPKVDK